LNTAQTYGFGVFSANLNTFFNSQGSSHFLPTLPHAHQGQYEGFGYLGLGAILLIFIALYSLFLKNINKNYIKINTTKKPFYQRISPLIVVIILFFLFSLSHKIAFNGQIVYEWRYGRFAAMFFETLRGSGRFIMLPFYGMLIWAFIRFYKLPLSIISKITILSFLLFIQILDIEKLLHLDKNIFAECTTDITCAHRKWKPLMQEASRVIVFTPYAWDFKGVNDFYPFCRAASEVGKPITTGYFARRNTRVTEDYQIKLYKNWELGNLAENDRALYIGSIEKAWRFKKLLSEGKLIAYKYDGYAVLIPPILTQTAQLLSQLPDAQKIDFDTEGVAEIVQKYGNKTVVAVAAHEASYKLDTIDKTKMTTMGAPEFSKLGWTGSYIAIFKNGKCIFEKLDNDKALDFKWTKGHILNGFLIKKDLNLYSAGADKGNLGSAKIEGKEYSPNRRGMNFVVLDDEFNVVATDFMDTFEQGIRAVIK
jgi:hypothetical protein